MPWKESSVLDQRMKFVMEYNSGLYSLAELCRAYGISRQTGYKWVERFEQEKLRGLEDRSRAPARHPNQTKRAIEERILELRRKYPSWGPRKLKFHLGKKYPRTVWPATSTIGALLKREGLTVARRLRRKAPPYTQPFRGVEEPNQVWCVDFKGWFCTGDGDRIDPLTMTDACSRYLLRCQAVEKTNTEQVMAIFESAFREYGMPWAIRSDNGAPFASRAIAGISRLSVYLMKLGIIPERIQPGHPEQNGRHERMHRTLGQETASPPAANRRSQQKAFDKFLRVYNEERPHEALQQKTPSSCYQASSRRYPARVKDPKYPRGMLVRRVPRHGGFSWKHQYVFLSECLAHEAIGLEPIDERYYTVYFANFPLGRFDSQKLRVDPLPAIPKPGDGENLDGVAKQHRSNKVE
jgi:transposase InsO family protein